MSTGYIRNDTSNNISDGNTIDAADFDGEFDAIQDAFHGSTGHTHDGTTGEGGPISTLGPTADLTITATTIEPRVDNTVDLGTATKEYKDIYVDGTAHIDTLDVDENAAVTGTLTVTGTAILGDVTVSGTFTPTGSLDVSGVDTDDLTVNSSVQSDLIPLLDSTYDLGTTTERWANTYFDTVTTTGNVTVGGNIVVSGTVDGQDIAQMAADIVSLQAGGLDGAAIKTLYEAEANTNAFTDAEKTKLAGVEAGADVTDTTAVLNAGALMDSECVNVAALKAVNQNLTTTSAVQFGSIQTLTGAIASATTVSSNTSMSVGTSLSVGTNLDVSGNISVGGTVDGYDIASMGSKLAGIEVNADKTDATNVNAAGALMESECASPSNLKLINQNLSIGASPSFGTLSCNITGNQSGGSINATTITGSSTVNIDSGTFYVDTTNNRVGIRTTSPSYAPFTISYDGDNSIGLVGTSGTSTGGISFYTVGGDKAGYVNIGSTGNLTVAIDPDSNVSDPYFKLNVKGSDVYRTYSDGVRIGEFANNPFTSNSSGDAGIWLWGAGRVDIGFDGVPTRINRIGSNGILLSFNKDGSDAGSITFNGSTLSIAQPSDSRLKENIEDYDGSSEVIKDIKVRSFNWKSDESKTEQIGFIAQELQSVLPTAVETNEETGMLNVRSNDLIPYIVGALSDALKRIEELEIKVKKLESRT